MGEMPKEHERVDIPLRLAEQLTVQQAELYKHSQRNKAGRLTEWGVYSRTCVELEKALCASHLRERKHFLGSAVTSLALLRGAEGACARIAGLILAYKPLYEQRMQRRPCTRDRVEAVYKSLSFGLDTIPYDKQEDFGFANEAFFLASCLSSYYLAFPSMPREESALSADKRYNHDAYLLAEKGKVPVQVKSLEGRDRRKYDPSILMVYMRKYVSRAGVETFDKSYWHAEYDGKRSQYIVPREQLVELYHFAGRALVADAANDKLSAEQEHFLQALRSDVFDRIDRFVSATGNVLLVPEG